jgi:hypothetical protein
MTFKGGPHGVQLLGCSIAKYEGGNGLGDAYLFFGPHGTNRSTAVSSTVPFDFPMFLASLNGDIDREWFIRVTHVDSQHIKGTWGNSHFHGPDVGDVVDPDVWTAQANQGEEIGDGEEKEKAAYASPKL